MAVLPGLSPLPTTVGQNIDFDFFGSPGVLSESIPSSLPSFSRKSLSGTSSKGVIILLDMYSISTSRTSAGTASGSALLEEIIIKMAAHRNNNDLDLITMNADGPHIAGNASKRKNAILNLVTRRKPHLIFFQEYKLAMNLWKRDEIKRKYTYIGSNGNSASILYDKNKLTCTSTSNDASDLYLSSPFDISTTTAHQLVLLDDLAAVQSNFPITFLDDWNWEAGQVNHHLRGIAQQLPWMQTIDQNEFHTFLGAARHLLSRDGLHLSPEGLERLASNIEASVRSTSTRVVPPSLPTTGLSLTGQSPTGWASPGRTSTSRSSPCVSAWRVVSLRRAPTGRSSPDVSVWRVVLPRRSTGRSSPGHRPTGRSSRGRSADQRAGHLKDEQQWKEHIRRVGHYLEFKIYPQRLVAIPVFQHERINDGFLGESAQ
ncbi:hypothetical protein MAR_018834 [Mya arenaria]|uniref:Endonuclease/exonuclease/phosphatase domain-containing protein n=1 Tax=Mya arenaria TaxID=6604 RepID=A0ABY7ENV2_MYAAR|nr:hypothetical protein MAR_018834 [Mya arenaria]